VSYPDSIITYRNCLHNYTLNFSVSTQCNNQSSMQSYCSDHSYSRRNANQLVHCLFYSMVINSQSINP